MVSPKTPRYVKNNHSESQNIGDKAKGVLTRSNTTFDEVNLCLIFEIESKTINEEAMKEELM